MDTQKMGETLKRLRGKKTLEYVSKELNISKSSLSKYENGDRIPRDEAKKKLADYYGKSVQYIFFK